MHMCFDVRTMARIMSSGEVLSTARLRDPQARCPLVAIFVAGTRCSGTHALYSAVLPPRPISHNILLFDQTMDTSQASHAIQQGHSNFNVAIKRVVVVFLWALPTPRASECVALSPTEIPAKDGRCFHGKPRGEGQGLFQKRKTGLEKYFVHVAGVLVNDMF